MLLRMQKERLTFSLDGAAAARVRQCGARSRGGASGYVERLIQDDALREAVRQHGAWFAAHPGYLEDADDEGAAAEDSGAA